MSKLSLNSFLLLLCVTSIVVNLRIKQQIQIANDLEHAQRAVFRHSKLIYKWSNAIRLLVLTDETDRNDYQMNILTQRCYAEKHGYEHETLDIDAYPECEKYDKKAFRKYCALKSYLVQEAEHLTLVVMDADTIGAVSEESLDLWLRTAEPEREEDIVFYERFTSHEVQSDTFIIRNSKFARQFLDSWANFEFHHPTGWSNGARGALQMLLLTTIGLKNAEKCAGIYHTKIAADETNKLPYYNFVGCAKKVMGPARVWKVATNEPNFRWRKIAIWPRFNGWAVDGYLVKYFTGGYHPFHHWVGNFTKHNEEYNFGFKVSDALDAEGNPRHVRCHASGHRKNAEWHGELGAKLDAEFIRTPEKPEYALVPRWQYTKCLGNFTCGPMGTGGPVNGLPFIYGTPDQSTKHYTPPYHHGVPAQWVGDTSGSKDEIEINPITGHPIQPEKGSGSGKKMSKKKIGKKGHKKGGLHHAIGAMHAMH